MKANSDIRWSRRSVAAVQARGGMLTFSGGVMSSGWQKVLKAIVVSIVVLFLASIGPATARGIDADPWAPFDAPWFDNLGSAEGLPPSIVTAVAQDRQGLVWVGTMAGLARYDGYRSQVFDTRGDHEHSLPDAYIRNLLALPDGSLLIGTNDGGLVRFDQASNRFHTFPVGPGGTSDRKIYALADDHAGGAWIATGAGLDHYDSHTGAITHVPTGEHIAARDFSVLQDRAGNLWLGNNDGLFVRRPGSDTFVRPANTNKLAEVVLQNQTWAISEDAAGRIWVGSGQAGAAYRGVDGLWHPVPGFGGHEGGRQQATVRDLLEIAPGTMWIATDGNGILAYSPGAAEYRRIDHDVAIASSLPGDSVRDLLKDRSGNVWAATDFGLASTQPGIRTAFSVLPSPLEPNTLRDSSVRAIYVDSRGLIWLGLGSGKIDVIDLKAGRMQHLELDGSQKGRDVHSFVEASDGSIWVGTQGMARIDPATMQVEPSILPELDNAPVLSLQRDGTRIIVGTYDGLYRYDSSTDLLDHITHDASDPTSLTGNTVRWIAPVGDKWWIATSHGISITSDINANNGFSNLLHHDGDPTSLPQDYVSAIDPVSASQVWVSTSGGLAHTEHCSSDNQCTFNTIGMQQGLSSDKLSALLVDDLGQVWTSSSNGMSMIDGKTHAVHNLSTRDGLHISSYHYAAMARAPGGEMLFGGLGGLSVIRPDWHPNGKTSGPLVITHETINATMVPFGMLPHNGDTIELKPHERSLHLDFALLDYQRPTETSYAYRMDGLDDAWVEIPPGNLPSVVYTNLPTGNYRLDLRARTRAMQPYTSEISLNLLVQPRWYETTIARVVTALLAAFLIFALVHLRTLYLRRQAVALQRQINDHTRDLRAANQRLDELAGTDSLTGVYNRRRFLELVSGLCELADSQPICIALFDLDRFKEVNDTYGHLAGDAVIRHTIKIIRTHCRQSDLVGRYGGEEFVVCLPDTDLPRAHEVAERMRQALAGTAVAYDDHEIAATVSIGVALWQPGQTMEKWLSRADEALYRAKHEGRNRCIDAD